MSGIQVLIQDYGLNGIGEGPIYNVQDVTISRELDGAGSFQFQAPLADERVNDLAANERRAVIYVYHPNGTSREIGSGVIRSKAESGDNWAVSGPDLLAELANENTLINRVYDGVALTTVLSELIALVRSNRNLCMGGTATTGGAIFAGHPVEYAFDRDDTTEFWPSAMPSYAEYQFLAAQTIRRYTITGPANVNYAPRVWTLSAYNSGTLTYDVVDTRSSGEAWNATEKHVFEVSSSVSSTNWRLTVTDTPEGTYTRINEITMSPLTDWTIDTTGVTGDFYGVFDGVSILKALQAIAAATGYHFRVEASRNIVFGTLGDAADLTIIQAGTLTDSLEDNNEIAILDQPLRQLTSEQITNWVLPLGEGTPPLSLEYLIPSILSTESLLYDVTNLNNWAIVNNGGTYRLTQSFTPIFIGTYSIFAVEVYVRIAGSPTNQAILHLWDNSASPLILSTATLRNEADISASGQWVMFWLDKPTTISTATKYWISLTTSAVEAGADRLEWGYDATGAMLDGNASSNDTWAASGTSDRIFRIWYDTTGEIVYTPREMTGPDGTTLYYLTDEPSVAEYGKVAQVLTVDVEAQGSELADLQNASLLIWRAANAWLSKHADIQTYYSASIRKAYSTIYPGQLTRLVYHDFVYNEDGDKVQWADEDDSFWVTRATESMNVSGEMLAQLQLATIAQAKEDAASRLVSAVENFTIDTVRRYYGPWIADEQSGTVFTPPAGKWSIYPKSDGLYIKDDAGAESKLWNVADLADVAADIIPDTDDTRDLGSSAKRWAEIWSQFALSDANGQRVKNTSGGAVTAGAPGYIDENGEFKTTTTDALIAAWCVVLIGGANNADIYVTNRGRVTITLNANCAIGDWLKLSTTGGQAGVLTYVAPEVFACALTANIAGAGGTCEALLYCKVDFVPLSLSSDVATRTSTSDSDFQATQNGAVSGATLVYNAPSAGDEVNLDTSGSGEVAKIVLHNTTRSEEALISDTNVGTNTITVVTAADIAAWVNTNALSIRSTINTDTVTAGVYFVDMELTTDVPALAYAIQIFINLITDTGGAGAFLVLHPYETGVASKRLTMIRVTGTNSMSTAPFTVSIRDRRFCIAWNATGAGALTFTLRAAGAFVKAP